MRNVIKLLDLAGEPISIANIDRVIKSLPTRPDEYEKAPKARQAHPREEHLLPLMVIAGAAEEDQGKQIYADTVMGMAISAYQFG